MDINRHYISDAMREQVRKAADGERGEKARFCRAFGIKPYTLAKILSGTKKYVYGDDWSRLCDAFPEFATPTVAVTGDNNITCAGNGNAIYGGQPAGDFIPRADLLAAVINLPADATKDDILRLIVNFGRAE